jgi:pimeloyl-ACP methyl ester carboxylesterase
MAITGRQRPVVRRVEMKATQRVIGCVIGLLASGGCSDDAGSGDNTGHGANGGQAGRNSGGSGAIGSGGGAATGSGGSAATGPGGTGVGGTGVGGTNLGGAGGMGGSGIAGASGMGGSGISGASGSGGTNGASGSGGGGPDVSIPGVACGGVLDANVMTPFATIGGRQVFIDYPCRKPQRTAVTFILNLHGTFQQESGKHYIRGYFPSYKFMDTLNLIIATPKSVVSQWANMDGGRDEPHLMAVVDWMYQNFAGFDIKQMWVVGHSWGAMYTRTFACKTEFTNKVKGVVLMSGGTAMPACASRLAVLGTVGETDIVTGELTQATTASGHGCGAQQVSNLGNNRVTQWPNCMPGWVHKNYFMLGKGHGFDPKDWPDDGMNKDLADAIVSTR